MIDDLRACTHKQLPELFPLMASLHPELQLRTPTDSPPQRRPLKQRRTHCDLEQAWDCILRKLPMPFEHFCGAEAWEMPAVWEQHCYDSVLAGKAVSAEDHRLGMLRNPGPAGANAHRLDSTGQAVHGLCMPSGTDNTASEAGVNKLFTTACRSMGL